MHHARKLPDGFTKTPERLGFAYESGELRATVFPDRPEGGLIRWHGTLYRGEEVVATVVEDTHWEAADAVAAMAQERRK
jgi:hypothetical protein